MHEEMHSSNPTSSQPSNEKRGTREGVDLNSVSVAPISPVPPGQSSSPTSSPRRSGEESEDDEDTTTCSSIDYFCTCVEIVFELLFSVDGSSAFMPVGDASIHHHNNHSHNSHANADTNDDAFEDANDGGPRGVEGSDVSMKETSRGNRKGRRQIYASESDAFAAAAAAAESADAPLLALPSSSSQVRAPMAMLPRGAPRRKGSPAGDAVTSRRSDDDGGSGGGRLIPIDLYQSFGDAITNPKHGDL